MNFVPPQKRKAWAQLQQLAQKNQAHSPFLLNQEPQTIYPLSTLGLTLDYAKQSITREIMQALENYAQESQVISQAHALFKGELVNWTEKRAALHMALRGSHWKEAPWPTSISQEVHSVLEAFCAFADQVRQKKWLGIKQTPITHVVHIGIGGSDTGPKMVVHALKASFPCDIDIRFASHPEALHHLLSQLEPSQTLFIVVSKTLTTPEIALMKKIAQEWQQAATPDQSAWHRHWALVSAASDEIVAQQNIPIASSQIFRFWDWVGGRFSLWSCVGLTIAIQIGSAAFKQLLQGAHQMDRHFLTASLSHNLPLRLALLTLWNRNFLGRATHVIGTYNSCLDFLTPFLQQMDMESLGKSVHIDGSQVNIDTGAIVWGGPALDAQHAYFQLLHQGTHRLTLDLIAIKSKPSLNAPCANNEAKQWLIRNIEAQSAALAQGRNEEETKELLQKAGLSPQEQKQLLPYRIFKGHIPHQLLWLDEMSPLTLGALIAAYEHKIFCLGVLWGINPFDQWGVELGKSMMHQ